MSGPTYKHITVFREVPTARDENRSAMAHYRTEVHIPVKKDSLTFEDRQRKAWNSIETQVTEKRSQWEKDFQKMKEDFFTLTPTDATSVDKFSKVEGFRSLYEVDSQGIRKLKICFDVSDFSPEEIQVKIQDNRIVIHGKNEEKKGNSTFSREYSRQIDIPWDVDQDKITCVVSKDGILTVEGPTHQQSPFKEATFLPIKCENVPSISHKTSVQNPIITEPDGSRKLQLQVDIGEFKPEEVVVKTMDRKLVVSARHEEKREGRTMHKEFNKEYELPESVDPMSVNAFLAEDGKLTIEAPLKPLPRQSYAVTQSSDVKKVVVTKESQFTITDSANRPMVTISVHPR
ncbi:Hypothetical predicted protein [Octopus vulgaris]|uniref:Uncharacterized protein n=3 Tax=Octopus TaxID=6643 RepID=A0AA36BAU7_OCTVU|nr:major egg antigen isoform X1 [Octopus sinensis]XP_036363462.1 major egg antigen isoform X1 [Octopus sinensis]XP_036363463.1 major egg antigen isoform X1 [Octopus sinensis]CAI9730151.1 Hypothetical predicted protein [Octopus vulgaris]